MQIEIIHSQFNPWDKLKDYEAQQSSKIQKYGATGVFAGTMRDLNEGQQVSEMILDYYPGMTEKYLQNIAEQSLTDDGILDILIVHRVGKILPNEPIVLIAVWSMHRKEAFEHSRQIMETLKTTAPFWKKENLMDGSSKWVQKNSKGY